MGPEARVGAGQGAGPFPEAKKESFPLVPDFPWCTSSSLTPTSSDLYSQFGSEVCTVSVIQFSYSCFKNRFCKMSADDDAEEAATTAVESPDKPKRKPIVFDLPKDEGGENP